MVQSLSWEANWFAASQEIPRISQNPKVHYHTHKRPPPIPDSIRAIKSTKMRLVGHILHVGDESVYEFDWSVSGIHSGWAEM